MAGVNFLCYVVGGLLLIIFLHYWGVVSDGKAI